MSLCTLIVCVEIIMVLKLVTPGQVVVIENVTRQGAVFLNLQS